MSSAEAVIMLDKTSLDLRGVTKAFYKREILVKILSPAAENLATVVVAYDAEHQIQSFDGWLYDSDSNFVKHFRMTDAEDYSTDGDALATDGRVKVWKMNRISPPFTLHYVIEEKLSGTCFLPEWSPISGEGIALTQGLFELKYKNGLKFHSKANHISRTDSAEGFRVWQVDQFPPIKTDAFAPRINEITPSVYVVPDSFELYGKRGSFSNWNSFGAFVSKLNSGRDELIEVKDPELKKIIGENEGAKEKAQRLYRYLQANFRYVSIQLGIGGWQPKPAAFTLEKKFGDCKALTTVMKALLKTAGIQSYYTLINASNHGSKLTFDFVHPNFNHAILCVPFPKDTVWLECTSASQPFNYLSNFTEDRDALLILPDGGRLIRTPAYTEVHNRSFSNSVIRLDENNTTRIKSHIIKEGELQEDIREGIHTNDDKQIEIAVVRSIKTANTKLGSLKFHSLDPYIPRVKMDLELTNQSTIKKTSSRLFVRTDIFKPFSILPVKDEFRIFPLEVGMGMTYFDTLIYHLPEGYQPESFQSQSVQEKESVFGKVKCEAKYETESAQLHIYRSFILKESTYEASQYSAFREFLRSASQIYCPELVFKR